MKIKIKMVDHKDMTAFLLGLRKPIIIIIALFSVGFKDACSQTDGQGRAADIEITASQQDGYTNDHAYNNTDPVLLCGSQGFVAVVEFPLDREALVRKAQLCLNVIKVKKPGRVALYHLLNFNNGYAETQDFYASAEKMGETFVEEPGVIVFDVTKAVKRDSGGPGGFTSYRLQGQDGEIVLSSFEGKQDKPKITVE